MTPIPPHRLSQHQGKQVHVFGWNRGATFVYLRTVGGVHYLRTPRSGKEYQTRNALAYTKRYRPVPLREILP